jgi:Flp pilus assembly protein CpaB
MLVRVLRFTGLVVPLLLSGVAAALAQTPSEIGKLRQQASKHGGMKAVTIRTNDSLGIAGFLQPGDRVDVLLKRTRGASAGDKVAYVEVLLRNVRVLAVDQIADGKGQAKADGAVTIEVTAEDAAKVALGMEIGTLALALLSMKGTNLETIEATRRDAELALAAKVVRKPPEPFRCASCGMSPELDEKLKIWRPYRR